MDKYMFLLEFIRFLVGRRGEKKRGHGGPRLWHARGGAYQ